MGFGLLAIAAEPAAAAELDSIATVEGWGEVGASYLGPPLGFSSRPSILYYIQGILWLYDRLGVQQWATDGEEKRDMSASGSERINDSSILVDYKFT